MPRDDHYTQARWEREGTEKTLGDMLRGTAEDLMRVRVTLGRAAHGVGRKKTFQSLEDVEARELEYNVAILEEAAKWADELTPQDAKSRPKTCPGCSGSPSSVWTLQHGWSCRKCSPDRVPAQLRTGE